MGLMDALQDMKYPSPLMIGRDKMQSSVILNKTVTLENVDIISIGTSPQVIVTVKEYPQNYMYAPADLAELLYEGWEEGADIHPEEEVVQFRLIPRKSEITGRQYFETLIM